MRQNISISIDEDLAGRLRALAAARSTSISAMLSEELRRIVSHAEAFENARRQALADLDAGLDLGGRPATRDDLHDRAGLR